MTKKNPRIPLQSSGHGKKIKANPNAFDRFASQRHSTSLLHNKSVKNQTHFSEAF
jgi:hypothetical protein